MVLTISYTCVLSNQEAEKHISECAEKISSLTLQLEQCGSALKAAREGEKQTRQEFEREKYDSQQTKMQVRVYSIKFSSGILLQTLYYLTVRGNSCKSQSKTKGI